MSDNTSNKTTPSRRIPNDDGTTTTYARRVPNENGSVSVYERTNDQFVEYYEAADGERHIVAGFDASLFDFEGLDVPEGDTRMAQQVAELLADVMRGATRPHHRLYIASIVAELAESAVARAARDANEAGYTWDQIGDVLGISRRTAANRYGRR